MLRSRLRAAIALSALLGCAAQEEQPLGWSVREGLIRDPEGRVAILRGVNLSGKHKNAPYLDFHAKEDFGAVRSVLGMNALRFLIEWAAIEPEPGRYDDVYLGLVRERMDWARDADLSVVLDMHQDVFGEGFPGGNGAPRWACDEERYAAFQPVHPWFLGYLDENVIACFDRLWSDPTLQNHYAQAYRHVAEVLGDHPAIIGFEVMNEPWLGSFSATDFEPRVLQPFYDRVVSAVRELAPHWLAFLEPASTSNLGSPTELEPFRFPNAVYAPHSYDSAAESGEGFDPARRGSVFEKLERLASEARRLGAALWIGEYGGIADHPGIGEYMDAEADAFSSVWSGSAYWDFSRSDAYGLQRPDGSEKPELWDAIVRPYPERVAGIPRKWSYDEVERVLELEYLAENGVSVLSVPSRPYPEGYSVSCERCSWVAEGAVVTITATPGQEVTVRVSPSR